MEGQTGAQSAAQTGNEEKPAPPEFLAFLAGHNRGRLADELSEKLAELVAAVADTGKKGTLQVTLAILPDKNGAENGAMTVQDAVKCSPPQHPRKGAMYFGGEDGVLRTSPKDQHAFDFGGAR